MAPACSGSCRATARASTALSSTLYIGDELWAWPDGALLEAMQTGLVKRRDSKLLAISTAAAQLDSPLGRLRARALAQPTAKRKGAVVASAGDLHWLEWSLPDEDDLDDMKAVKRANPAPWIGVAGLKRQRAAVPDLAFQQFHACRWGLSEGSWLPAGAWQACVGAAIYHGDAGVLECVEQVRDLAAQYSLREVVFDPWRFGQAAQELERERVPVLAFPQTDVRMVPASIRLHAAIVEQRLTLPDDPQLASHAAHTIARHSRRGWRLDKASPRDHMDGIVALAIALERAEVKPEPVELLGWL